MANVALPLYVEPGSAEVFVVLYQKDGGTFRFTAVVDTGAAISLFPRHFLETIDHQVINSAVEATLTGFLEDTGGFAQKTSGLKHGLLILMPPSSVLQAC